MAACVDISAEFADVDSDYCESASKSDTSSVLSGVESNLVSQACGCFEIEWLEGGEGQSSKRAVKGGVKFVLPGSAIKSKDLPSGTNLILPCMEDLEAHSILVFGPLSLECLYRWCSYILQAVDNRSPELSVIIGPFHCAKDLTNAALLAGAFLLLCRDVPLLNVVDMLEPVSSFFEPYEDELTVPDALFALGHATRVGWLDFKLNFLYANSPTVPENFPKLDMAEFVHHACETHGRMHIVVPDKVYIFSEPDCERLANSTEWIDVGGERFFSSAFYAELLNYMEVNIVIKDFRSRLDESALGGKGIQIEDLDFRHDDDLLHKTDRLLSTASHPDSVMAIEKCPQGDRVLKTLLMILLMRQCGFATAKHSLAWLHMVLRS